MSKIIWIFLLSFLIFENISFCYSYVSNKREYTLINCRENFHPTCLSIFLYMYLYLTVPYLFIWDSPSIRDLRVLTYFDHFDYLNSLLSKIMSNFWRLVRKSAKVKLKKNIFVWNLFVSKNLLPFPNSGIDNVAMMKKAFPWHYALVYYGGMKS